MTYIYAFLILGVLVVIPLIWAVLRVPTKGNGQSDNTTPLVDPNQKAPFSEPLNPLDRSNADFITNHLPPAGS